MSRLDSFIRRMTAQRTLLNSLAAGIGDLEGPILELGLGNGRTYDHLREILPGREIFAFDRNLFCHPSCVPADHFMIVGEIRETLEFCGPRIGTQAALIHCDLGSGDPTTDMATASWLSPHIDRHLRPGGSVLSGLALNLESYEQRPMPEGIPPGRYYHYCKPA